MSKFNHKFKLNNLSKSTASYSCDDNKIQIDFVSPTCMRVALFKNEADMLPTFSINPSNTFSPIGRNRLSCDGFKMFTPKVKNTTLLQSFYLDNNIRVEVNPDNFIISYYSGDSLLFSDRKPLAYNFEKEFGAGLYHYITRSENEKIFGLGDKGGELNKAGRTFRIETGDAMGYNAKSSDPLYKHIPFYICENDVGCYGLFYDTSDTSFMDLGSEINNYYSPFKYFKTNDNTLVYYVFFGTKLSILTEFAKMCGRQPLPPKWSFDYCASTMAYTDAPKSQEKMQEFISKLKDFGLSCQGFYLSSGYTSIGNQRCVFNWNHDKFPDVKKFVSDFKNENIELIPNIKPAFLTSHPLYNEIAQKGYFVKNPDGTPFITEFWDGLGSYIDFTNPDGFDFWSNKVDEALLSYGITSTWNDNNEFDIKDTDALAVGFGNGLVKASRIRPVLTYLMNASSYKAQTEKYPLRRPFLSTRSGGIGVRRFAQTWSGDNRTAFEDLRYCHNIGLTLSLSGLFFYGHDLGGFSGDMPSSELLLRWLQHGIFEPRLTIHSWNSDGSATMPWSYPEVKDSVLKIFAQRKKLLPYIYSCAYDCVLNDEPMNAPAFLYYDDENLYNNTDSMLLGRNIYACFAFDEGVNEVNAYLPKGDSWYLGDKLYQGGTTVNLQIEPTDEMPYFVKSGCVMPFDVAEYGYKCNEKIEFVVYPIDNGTFESRYFNDDGTSFEYLDNNCVKVQFNVSCDDNSVNVSYKNYGNMPFNPKIRLCGGDCRKLNVVAEE